MTAAGISSWFLVDETWHARLGQQHLLLDHRTSTRQPYLSNGASEHSKFWESEIILELFAINPSCLGHDCQHPRAESSHRIP